MITRYVLHLTCTKDDAEGKPRRLMLTFLSAGGNNVKGDNGYTHKLVAVLEGEDCPVDAPKEAHTFIVTPTSYNEWVKQAEERFARHQWNRG